MIGIILAGGYATRLKPLTENMPKHLLPINGKPMLSYMLEAIHNLKLSKTYLVTNNKFANTFAEWVATTPYSDSIVVVNDGTNSNDDRLGSLGDILFTIKQENIDDDLFIFGADNITDFDFSKLVAKFTETQKPVIGIVDIEGIDDPRQMGVVLADKDGKIVSFEEKPAQPKTSVVSTLFYVLPKSAIATIEHMCANGKSDKAGWLIEELLSQGDVYTVTHFGYWFDIGTLETYEKTKRFFEEK